MADVISQKLQYKYDFVLGRTGADDESRSMTLDTTDDTGAGETLAKAKALRDLFVTGSASGVTLAAVDPTQFIQPTGWRDNDPNDAPYTVKSCKLSLVNTTTTTYDGGEGGGDNPRNITYDSNGVIKYTGLNSTDAPLVAAFYSNEWHNQAVEYSSSNGGWIMSDEPAEFSQLSITAPATAEYQPATYVFNY